MPAAPDYPSMPSMPTLRGGGASRPGEPVLGRIDHYDLLRKLGGGGFGVVYLAKDTNSGVEVALKTLHPLLKSNAEEMDALREKFALVSRLTHTNIAKALVLHRVHDLNIWDETTRKEMRLSPGDSVMVMDYAPGVTLSRWRKQFPDGIVPLDLALEIAHQLASALDYAHGERIVHRDIKPGNIMIETLRADEPRGASDHEVEKQDGIRNGGANRPGEPPLVTRHPSLVTSKIRARILDFGLAAEIRSSMSRVSTEQGDTSGTRPYMAPEQWLGKKQDGHTDQYALACVLYEMLSGAPPFAGVFETGDPIIMANAVRCESPEEIDDAPPAVNAALLRALAKTPKERFPSCTEFISALSSTTEHTGCTEDDAGRARPPGAPQNGVASRPGDPRRRRGIVPWLCGAAAAVAALVAVALVQDARYESRMKTERKSLEEGESRALAEAKAKVEAERKARIEAEKKAEAEQKARKEAEAKVARAEAQAKAEVERKAEAERKARIEAEKKAEAEQKAREEAEAKAEAERKAAEERKRPKPDGEYTETVSGIPWTFTIFNGHATVGNYPTTAIPTNTAGAVTIPSRLGGVPVTKIDIGAFKNCSNITRVSVPEGVTNGVALIEGKSLEEISLPAGFSSFMGYAPFGGSPVLKTIRVAPGNRAFVFENGILFSYDRSTLVRACPGAIAGHVVVPDGTTTIGNGAFAWCDRITSIHLPASVKRIGSIAFNGCTGLTTIEIPQGVTDIGNNSFCGQSMRTITVHPGNPCYRMVDGLLFFKHDKLVRCPDGRIGRVDIPPETKVIGDFSFSDCTQVTGVSIPDGVVAIGKHAFWCSGIQSVEVPDGVTSIGDYAFAICSNLKTVSIPSSVTQIGGNVFQYSNIEKLSLPSRFRGREKEFGIREECRISYR